MEGDFVLGYLGNTILSKATASGLGTIQKPLRDTYFEYRKTSGKKGKRKELTEVGLRVSPQGVYILVAGSHPGNNESFYDMPSISFFEAVRFKTIKGTDKKVQAGFLPIDINRSPNTGSEKLFTPLDKKYQTFAKMDHPAILALVMRRTSGVRALECHMFVCENEQQSLNIVNMMGFLQERGADPRSPGYQRQNSGPFDPYAGPPRRPDLVEGEFRDPGPGFPRGGPGPTDFRGPRNPDGWEGPEPDRYDPRDRGPPPRDERFGPPRGYDEGEERMMKEGRYPPEDEVQFRHQRQRSSEYGRREEIVDRRSGDFRHERQRSSEYNRGDIGDRRSGDFRHERQGSNDYRHDRQGSGDFRHERQSSGDFRHERQSSGDFRHERQSSGDVRGDRRSGGIFHERQRSGEIAPRDMRRSVEKREYERPGRLETRQDGQFRIPRPMSPVRAGPVTAPKPSRALSPGPFPRSGQYAGDRDYQERPPLRSPRDEPLSPRDRGPPLPQGPEYSLSSLESRQDMENRPNKPVARVPPHLVAGVKVLPTGFQAAIQQKAGQRSPKSPRQDPRGYEEPEENPYDNAMSRREFYKQEGRKAKSESERYFDEPGRETRYTYHPPPDVLPPEERDRQREKINNPDYDDYDRVIRRDNNYNDQKGQNANYRFSAPPNVREEKQWSYDEQFQKYAKEKDTDYLGKSNSANDFRFYESGGSGERKVYEVQDRFNKMNIQNQTGLEPTGTNFEESLGYFP